MLRRCGWALATQPLMRMRSMMRRFMQYAAASCCGEALFLCLYKNFATVLSDRLHETFGEKNLDHVDGDSEAMAVDEEDTPATETDKENGNSKRNVGYAIGEKEQWCLSTLGYVKAFSRQYASEIWPHMDKLEEEVVTEGVHPLFTKAVYSGLRLHADE
ncbi:hypothetical protein R6Q57_003559 [Mikania cordata]